MTSCKLYEEILQGVKFSLNFPCFKRPCEGPCNLQVNDRMFCLFFVCSQNEPSVSAHLCFGNRWKTILRKNGVKQWSLVFTRLLCMFVYFKEFEYLHVSFTDYSTPGFL